MKRQDIGVEDEVDYQQEGIEDEEDTKMIEDEEEEEDDEEEDGVAMQVEDVDDGEEEEAPGFGGDLKRKLPVELISQDEPSKKKKKKRKKSEKCLVCGEKGHRKMDCSRLPEERRKELQDLFNMKVESLTLFLYSRICNLYSGGEERKRNWKEKEEAGQACC